MTLIVAHKCSDGVVVGADTLATLGSFGQHTVQERLSKLHIVREELILAVSGPVGLAQRYQEELEASPAPKQKYGNKKPMAAAVEISAAFWQHASLELQRAQVAAQATQNRTPLDNALAQAVVAVRTSGADRLFQFSETCAPEEATTDLPYVSIGSAQRNADPFLSFLRRLWWRDSLPTVGGAVLTVLWALQQTIEATAEIGGGPQIAVLQSGKARLLDDEELREHRDGITSIEKLLVEWKNRIASDVIDVDTEPPNP